jgi:MFS family permease
VKAAPQARAEARPLFVFVAGVALWYAATGMQTVLFSWLVVGELAAPAEVVGLVQMAQVAPVLALLLLGGAAADRVDRRRLLGGLQLAAAGLALGLAALVAVGRLSLPLLVAYAAGMGALTAFVLPARDAFLSEVAGGNLMRAATALTLAQFGAQALGTLAAGSAQLLGLAPALAAQALLLLLASGAARGLPAARTRAGDARGRLTLAMLGAGFAEVARSPALRATPPLLSGIGLFFSGAYHVVMPVALRDHYGGGVAELSAFMTALQAGVVLGACALLLRGRVPRRGRALVASLAGAGLPILVLAAAPPFPLLLAAGLAWGLCVALFQSIGRAILQEGAPEAQRARVLAVYSLAVMGAGVVGSPLAGWLAGHIGPLAALAAAACGTWLFVGLLALRTRVWRVD